MISTEETEPKNVEASDLQETWSLLTGDERAEAFRLLPADEGNEFFLELAARDQAELLTRLPARERRLWLRLLAPDDAADVLQEVEPPLRDELMVLLDDQSRREVTALLAYAEDDAGGLMSPRFARVRPDMSIDESILYLRKQARDRLETLYYAYVVDNEQRLQGVVSFRDLFQARPDQKVRDVMKTDLVTVPEEMDQEAVSRLFAQHGLVALPVLDAQGRMKGIVTVDDIVEVVEEEATEDIQKLGGMEQLDAPYLDVGFWQMIRKRGGWLSALFIGEMLTASAMALFEGEIARAVVLAVFLPLIISSGGNSGSQASMLVVRAMALGEVRLRDWWRVVKREIWSGLTLGTMLACISIVRILSWQAFFHTYGVHHYKIAATVAISLVGVVTFGTLAGSILPFILRRLGFDPASASAPFVATLVDVTGLVIYFTTAMVILRGTLL